MTLPISTARDPDLTDLENKRFDLEHRDHWKVQDPRWNEKADMRLSHSDNYHDDWHLNGERGNYSLPYQNEDKFNTHPATMSDQAVVRAVLRTHRLHDKKINPTGPYDRATKDRLRFLEELNDRGLIVELYDEHNSKAINTGVLGNYVHPVGPPFNGYFWWHERDMDAAFVGDKPREIISVPKTSSFVIPLAKTAKRKYEKNYVEKFKTDSGGTVRVYDEKHVNQRWKKKERKIKFLEKNIGKLRKRYHADLKSDDAKTRAIAALVGLIDSTAIRVGNEESVGEFSTFGATTLQKRHVKTDGGKLRFKFLGKSNVQQDHTLDDAAVAKEIRGLLKDKGPKDKVFEYESGKSISAKVVNRYLASFDLTAKDLRGFAANHRMKEKLKKTKDWDKALKEVAEDVGHEEKTLESQYLSRELVKKYKGDDDDKDDKSPKKTKKKSYHIVPLSKTAEDPQARHAALEAAVDKILGGAAPSPAGARSKLLAPPGASKGPTKNTGKSSLEGLVTSHYGERTDPITGEKDFHSGVDLKAKDKAGNLVTIKSIGDGQVIYAGWQGGKIPEDFVPGQPFLGRGGDGFGQYVQIKHKNGFVSTYGHMSDILVQKGQEVARGELIGTAGQTGRVTGPHLHIQLQDAAGNKVDPLKYIR